MKINFESEKPIFIQVAEVIEDAILSGTFEEETQIPSTTEFSVSYKINPATALKGINILVDKGLVYKKRGVGMFVCEGACDKLRLERKQAFYENFIKSVITEAKRLKISTEEIKSMIERGYENEQN
ncbi:MAG: GntR family transcriptional regulator [Acutalibacteraceae bacterium]